MRKWLLLALIVGVALGAIGCKSSPQASAPPAPQATAAAPSSSAQPAAIGTGETCSAEGGSCSGQSCAAGGVSGQKLQLTVRLPKEALEPAAPMAGRNGFSGQGSPAAHVLRVLQVTMTKDRGCVIGSVTKGGPADRAGLKPGDAIIASNGGAVDSPAMLDAWLYCSKEPGVAEVTVIRPAGASAKAAPEKK